MCHWHPVEVENQPSSTPGHKPQPRDLSLPSHALACFSTWALSWAPLTGCLIHEAGLPLVMKDAHVWMVKPNTAHSGGTEFLRSKPQSCIICLWTRLIRTRNMHCMSMDTSRELHAYRHMSCFVCLYPYPAPSIYFCVTHTEDLEASLWTLLKMHWVKCDQLSDEIQ